MANIRAKTSWQRPTSEASDVDAGRLHPPLRDTGDSFWRSESAGGDRLPDRPPQPTHADESASAVPPLLASRRGTARAPLPLRARALSNPVSALGEPRCPASHVP